METPGPPSMTMSSNRVDCAFGTTLKVALPDLPGTLTQPGRMLSSLSWVRSASMPILVSWSPILPESLIGIAPETAGPRSSPSRARLAVIEACRLAADFHVALDLIALIVGDDFQRVRFELLAHHQLVGRETI